jgi:hypothetical protein
VVEAGGGGCATGSELRSCLFHLCTLQSRRESNINSHLFN